MLATRRFFLPNPYFSYWGNCEYDENNAYLYYNLIDVAETSILENNNLSLYVYSPDWFTLTDIQFTNANLNCASYDISSHHNDCDSQITYWRSEDDVNNPNDFGCSSIKYGDFDVTLMFFTSQNGFFYSK